MEFPQRIPFLLAPLALSPGLVATLAHATWSHCIVDVRTGEVASGQATCVAAFDLLNLPIE
jgi:hypothetical protein